MSAESDFANGMKDWMERRAFGKVGDAFVMPCLGDLGDYGFLCEHRDGCDKAFSSCNFRHYYLSALELRPDKLTPLPPRKQEFNFYALVQERCEKIKDILAEKGAEYASDDDRFHNFNVAARIYNTTPVKALKGMMLKHEVSVLDFIEWDDTAPEKLTNELIDEKLGDNINYLILLEGLLKKRLNDDKEAQQKRTDGAGAEGQG